MNEFELVESFYLVQENLQSNFITISTGAFAFVIVSHFVGRELGRKTAAMLSVIYSLFIVPPIMMRIPEFNRWHSIHVEYTERFPEGIIFQGEAAPLIWMYITGQTPFLLAWIMSLVYLHLIVRRKS